MNNSKTVGIFTTCIADMLRPNVVEITIDLVQDCGFAIVVPKTQTCCGQPALNAGRNEQAKQLLYKLANEFVSCDYVVAPSGSCIGAIKTHMAKFFKENDIHARLIHEFANKCFELSQFLTKFDYQPKEVKQKLKIVYHDSCAGLRELNIKQEPRDLLLKAGHELVALKDDEVCCGFGGSFSVKFSAVSSHMADDKCDCAINTKADVLAMGDLGCVLNVEGRMLMRDDNMRVCHYVELLKD